MLSISGYEIQQRLRETPQTIIYQAKRLSDQSSVIVKVSRTEFPSFRKIAQFRYEYELLQRLSGKRVIHAYSIEECSHGLALVLEDFGGISLREWLKEGSTSDFELSTFFHIATQLTEAVRDIHDHGVIHKDLKPDNILIEPGEVYIKLTDFGISTTLTNELTLGESIGLEGTLQYLAPEQTGRINRSIDYRTDLYALGVVFYELLTGEPPFRSRDPLELIHAHLAQKPLHLLEIRPDLPKILAEVVMKLLEKRASARYQSAKGLLVDLQRCQRDWGKRRSIESFVLGEQDISGKFQIPSWLYGQEKTLEKFMSVFSRVSYGTCEIVLCSGIPGSGKSSLVNELHGPVAAQRGYFASGRSDTLKRDLPYAPLLQAIQSLLLQLLAEPKEEVLVWKELFLRSLRGNGKVLVEVLPELEILIGEQPEVVVLGPTESANRFQSILQDLLKVFGERKRPLVLFLDDLQWADRATLSFLSALLFSEDYSFLMWVLSFRGNEVESSHPLQLLLDDLRAKELLSLEHELTPLGLDELLRMCSDTLKQSHEEVAPLAEFLLSKTKGNPFFAKSVLETLYEKKVIFFDEHSSRWDWLKERLDESVVGDNAKEFMALKISSCSKETQRVLMLAACIGEEFSLPLLSDSLQQSPLLTAGLLWEAIEHGLLRPVGEGYKLIQATEDLRIGERIQLYQETRYSFAHERIQQASYSMLSGDELAQSHLRVGRLLAERGEQTKDTLLSITEHFNLALPLIKETKERTQLAGMNFIAGRQALEKAAYDTALNHLRKAIELLPKFPWQKEYELTFAVFRDCMSAEYLGGYADRGLELFEPLKDNARTLEDKIDLYVQKCMMDVNRGHFDEAILTGLEGLSMLGISMSRKGSTVGLLREFFLAKWNQGRRKTMDLLHGKECKEPVILAQLKLLIAMTPAAYFLDPVLLSTLLIRITNLSLKHGLSEVSSYGFAGYGIVLSGAFGDYLSAAKYGDLAIALCQRFPNHELEARIQFINAYFLAPWKCRLSEIRELFLKACEVGYRYGDLEYASYSAGTFAISVISEGVDIETSLRLIRINRDIPRRIEDIDRILSLSFHIRYLELLHQEVEAQTDLYTEDMEAYPFLESLSHERTPSAVYVAYVREAQLYYYYGEISRAYESIVKCKGVEDAGFGAVALVDLYFFHGLIAARYHDLVEFGLQRKMRRVVHKVQKKLALWESGNTENFASMHKIILAEQARIKKQDLQVLVHLESAVHLAQKHNEPARKALALELAARFCFNKRLYSLGEGYCRKANQAYILWGAHAKAKHLQKEFQIFEQSLSSSAALHTGTVGYTATASGGSDFLDLHTVLKASQAISSEIVLDNAGARKGFVLLPSESGLLVEAKIDLQHETHETLQALPLNESDELCEAVVHFVANTQKEVVLENASQSGRFVRDPFILRKQSKSLMCFPITRHEKLAGILYLENDLSEGVFTENRLVLFKQLAAQIAISIENARLYKNLNEARDKAVAAEQTKTRFLMNMSHELRTPLNAIIGYAEIIGEDLEEDELEHIPEDLEKICKAAKRLVRTLSALLELSKLDVGGLELELSSFTVAEVVEDVVSELQKSQHGNTIEVQLAPELSVIHTDRFKFRYCLESVMDNACRFTKNGLVRLACSILEIPGGNDIQFVISDTGIGIPAKKISELFEAFTQVDDSTTRRYEGSGVSLAIVKHFCGLLEGQIEVESEEGKGTTFTLRFPVELS